MCARLFTLALATAAICMAIPIEPTTITPQAFDVLEAMRSLKSTEFTISNDLNILIDMGDDPNDATTTIVQNLAEQATTIIDIAKEMTAKQESSIKSFQVMFGEITAPRPESVTLHQKLLEAMGKFAIDFQSIIKDPSSAIAVALRVGNERNDYVLEGFQDLASEASDATTLPGSCAFGIIRTTKSSNSKTSNGTPKPFFEDLATSEISCDY
ncbi:hypothetical protein B0J14DRAFT_697591 [Halenospora varia]|nr:hypothetical protein B0J14DRAFT_697591 [Halenospora varia]